MNTTKDLFLVPARSSSKRIKNKNLVDIGGESLLTIAIKKLLLVEGSFDIALAVDDINYYEHVCQSIVDEDIKQRVLLFRRTKFSSSDTSTLEDVISETIKSYDIASNYNRLLVHQCTSPFLRRKTIQDLYTDFKANDYDSIFTTIKSHNFTWSIDNTTKKIYANFDLSKIRARTQDTHPLRIETGGIWGMRLDMFSQFNRRVFGCIKAFDISRRESMDIDELEDLEEAKLLYPIYRDTLF